MNENELTEKIIGAAIEVHRVLGPGLLEAAYEECLCKELALRGIPFERQVTLALEYKGTKIKNSYRIDILVAGIVVVEIKANEGLLPVHKAQLLTYLKLGGWKVGLLINFNVSLLKKGVTRVVLGLEEPEAATEKANPG
jgi:GxxExxY protein